MDICNLLAQTGLVLGFIGAILLFFSEKKGVIMPDGRMRFDGLSDLAPVDKNKKIVQRSYWRNKWFTPIGWCLLSLSFLLQFISTLQF